jgi:hypothetical protein
MKVHVMRVTFVKMDITEIGCEDGDWIQLVVDRICCQAFLHENETVGFIIVGNFLDHLCYYNFL